MEALHFFIWLTMKGVQGIHEPHKLTSGASLFVNGSPNQLLAKQNSLRASYYVGQAPQLSMVQQLQFQNPNMWLLQPPKAIFFFKKSQNVKQ